jgi:hypothetical protein
MSAGLWRVGGKVGRNVYLDDVEVAVFVGAEGTAAALARAVVKTLNEAALPTPRPCPTTRENCLCAFRDNCQIPDAEYRQAAGAPVLCGAAGPDGLTCRRPPGHADRDGQHGSGTVSGELVRW